MARYLIWKLCQPVNSTDAPEWYEVQMPSVSSQEEEKYLLI